VDKAHPSSTSTDPIALVEAAYQSGSGQSAWLDQLADSALGFDAGLGLVAFSGQIVPERGLEFTAHAPRMNPELMGTLAASAAANPSIGANSVSRACSGATFSEAMGVAHAEEVLRPLLPWGCRDLLGVTAIEPGGFVLGLTIMLPEIRELSRREQVQWDRLAAHLAAGHRLQRRLLESSQAPDSARELGDAIVRVDGRVEHAREAAQSPAARASLRDAALAIDKARSSLRRKDPDEALWLWRALVAGRWSLVDKFDSDGRRYLVAHRNDPRTRVLAALTPREQQVTAYLALGHSNKRIAYELGLSESTVSEVGRRSLGKLGISSRADLARLHAMNAHEFPKPEP
jgi:DNA-binding CsgD family transcriptional regulator